MGESVEVLTMRAIGGFVLLGLLVCFADPVISAARFKDFRNPGKKSLENSHFLRSLRSDTNADHFMRALREDGSHFLRTLRSKPGSKDLQRILRSDPGVPIMNNDLERDLRSDDHFLRSSEDHFLRSLRSSDAAEHFLRSLRSADDLMRM